MNACLISATVGVAVCSSNSVALIIIPFWQKPHNGTCSSIQACCTGCSVFSAVAEGRPFCAAHRGARPSSVVTSLPVTLLTGNIQERTSLPSTKTEQDPHCARPQPNCGPLSPRSLRNTYNNGVSPGD